MEPFLEVSDAARCLGLGPASIRLLAKTGRLRVVATTRRGGRLFLSGDVEALRQLREEQAAQRAERGGTNEASAIPIVSESP
jgi:hypothetical protein